MGSMQAIQPVFGEERIWPPLMVRPKTATAFSLALAKNAPQATAKPAVEISEDVPMTVTKVSEPAPKSQVQLSNGAWQTLPGGPAGFDTNGFLDLFQAFLSPQAPAPSEVI